MRWLAIMLLVSPECLAWKIASRLQPDVSPSAESAAIEVARDIAAAMKEHSANTAGVAAPKHFSKAAAAAVMRTLAEAGIDARTEWAWPAKIIPRPKVECQIALSHDQGQVRAKLTGAAQLMAKQRYVDKPWVVAADRAVDADGIAVLDPTESDKATRCVGRSDPCSTRAEAKTEADRRLALALDRAVHAKLGDKWLVVREHVEPSQVLWLLGPSHVDAFTQTLDRPYGTMHRVYRLARLTEPELATLTHRAEGAWLVQKLVPVFKAIGVFASAVLMLLAYLLVAGRFGRMRWLLRVASLVLWYALVVAFVYGL